MKIRTALLDLDDTICNSTAIYDDALASCTEIFNSATGLNWSVEQFINKYNEVREEVITTSPSTTSAHNRGLYFQKMIESLMLLNSEAKQTEINNTPSNINGTLKKSFDIGLAYTLYQTYFNYLFLNLKMYPDAEELLRWLKESGRTIVIVSDGNTHIRLQKIYKLGIGKYIDYLVSSEEAGESKPSASPFLIALNKSKSRPEEAVMVGNLLNADVYGANRLGITTILKSSHSEVSKIPDEHKPKYTVNDLMKVKDIIEFIEGKERK